MNIPSLAFFQAGATVIPTLLIAIAVGLKHAELIGRYFSRSSTRARPYILAFWGLLVLMILLGELGALRAIARGSGNVLEAEQVWGAVTICLLLIVIEMMQPLAQHMSPRASSTVFNSITVGFVLLAIYIFLIFNGVLPL